MKTIHNLLSMSVLTLLLLLGVACATSTQLASNGADLPTGPTPPQAATPTTPQDHDDGVPRIKPADAVREVKAGEAILVDVRDTGSYETMHAKGALNVTYQSISEGKYDKLPKNKHLIFYCTWPNEHSSAGAAAILKKEKGYENVSALLGGLYGYKDAGGEVETKEVEPKK